MPVYLDVDGSEFDTKPTNWGMEALPNRDLIHEPDNDGLVMVYSSGPWETANKYEQKDIAVKAVLVSPDHEIDVDTLWSKTDVTLTDNREDNGYCLYGEISLSQNDNLETLLASDEADCLPIVAQYWPTNKVAWGWAKVLRGYQILAPLCAHFANLNLMPAERGICLALEGKEIGKMWFWLDNWSPTFIIDSATSVGVTLCLNKEFIHEIEKTFAMEIRYLCRVQTANRDKGYGQYNFSDKFYLFDEV